jgi:hypothetical protein
LVWVPDRKAWRRPTLPQVGLQYHGRARVSRPSSEWGRVGHLGCDHQAVRSGADRTAWLSWILGHPVRGPGPGARRTCWCGRVIRSWQGFVWSNDCFSMVGARSWRGASSIERLGSVSSTPCGASTADLSTWWSSTALIARPGFEGGFPLRCFQRLSCPDLATQLCRWHDNWSTRGPSTPVLSY